jgi:hypothetical protein
MSHIFIAHVEEDADVALKIALGLEEAGYKTWCYEIDSLPGPDYLQKTGEAIEQSGAVVVIISPHSLGSNQVTNEVVRAYEERKRLIPLLRDITHAEFQQRQPVWRQAIGAAASVRIPKDGIAVLITQVTEGLKSLGIKSSGKADAARISRLKTKLDEIRAQATSQEGKSIVPAKPREEIKKPKSRKPLIITLALVIVIAIIVVVIFLTQGGNKDQDHGLTSNLTSTKPVATGTSTPTVTPTTLKETAKPTTTSTPSPTSTPTPTPATTPAPVLKPDLVIQDMTWSPKNPDMGYDVTFTVTVTNIGKSNSLPSYIAYYIDDKFGDSISVSTINSGATGKVSFRWKAELGSHTIKAIADLNDSVTESDETNNTKEIDFSATVASDLIIQDITWTQTTFGADGQIIFNTTVQNQGNGTAKIIIVRIYIDGTSYPPTHTSISGGIYSMINELYGGQTTLTIAKWDYIYQVSAGNHIIRAVVDSDERVPESDETNNAKEFTITVK